MVYSMPLKNVSGHNKVTIRTFGSSLVYKAFSPDLTVTVSESGPREFCVTAATETEYLLPGCVV